MSLSARVPFEQPATAEDEEEKKGQMLGKAARDAGLMSWGHDVTGLETSGKKLSPG